MDRRVSISWQDRNERGEMGDSGDSGELTQSVHGCGDGVSTGSARGL